MRLASSLIALALILGSATAQTLLDCSTTNSPSFDGQTAGSWTLTDMYSDYGITNHNDFVPGYPLYSFELNGSDVVLDYDPSGTGSLTISGSIYGGVAGDEAIGSVTYSCSSTSADAVSGRTTASGCSGSLTHGNHGTMPIYGKADGNGDEVVIDNRDGVTTLMGWIQFNPAWESSTVFAFGDFVAHVECRDVCVPAFDCADGCGFPGCGIICTCPPNTPLCDQTDPNINIPGTCGFPPEECVPGDWAYDACGVWKILDAHSTPEPNGVQARNSFFYGDLFASVSTSDVRMTYCLDPLNALGEIFEIQGSVFTTGGDEYLLDYSCTVTTGSWAHNAPVTSFDDCGGSLTSVPAGIVVPLDGKPAGGPGGPHLTFHSRYGNTAGAAWIDYAAVFSTDPDARAAGDITFVPDCLWVGGEP